MIDKDDLSYTMSEDIVKYVPVKSTKVYPDKIGSGNKNACNF